MTKPHVLYAVLDTNVLFSALWKRGSHPYALVAAIANGRLMPVVSEGILAEYRDVLFRSNSRFTPDDSEALIQIIIQAAALYTPVEELSGVHMPDKDDVVFYATALASRAAGNATYLVTGNLRHFPQEDFIVSPRAMLDIIGQGVSA